MQLAEVSPEDTSADKTVEQWFRGRCDAAASKRVMPLLDAYYANDLCSDLRSLGVAEAALEARSWSDGEDTLVKGGTMAPLTAALSRGVPLRLGWPVREIRWREQGGAWSRGGGAAASEAAAEVVGTNGEVRACVHACMHACISTVEHHRPPLACITSDHARVVPKKCSDVQCMWLAVCPWWLL